MPRVSFGLSASPLRSYDLNPESSTLQIVGAREQTGEQVLAAIVADRGLHRLGARVRDRDGRAGQHAAARVLDVAADAWRSSSPGRALSRSSATACTAPPQPNRGDGALTGSTVLATCVLLEDLAQIATRTGLATAHAT